MSKGAEKDLELKLRFKRLLFLMGYYSPINVELIQYEGLGLELKRASLTDLDVLGVKFDPAFTAHRIVADCKTGKRLSEANRLFWLRGVTEYFGANAGYFICPKIHPHARAIAPKLGLRAVDEDDLRLMEEALDADSLVLPLQDPEFYQRKQSRWGISLPKGSKPSCEQLLLKQAYGFLSYTYWYVEQHRALLMLVARFQEIAHLLRPADERSVLLAYAGLERFFHCLLEMASHVSARGISDVQRNARVYLFGGPLALREKEAFFELLRGATGADEKLDPPFLGDVLELLNRVIKNPVPAAEVLADMEAIYDWCVLLGETDLGGLFGEGCDTGAIVLCRDAAITFAKAAGLQEGLFAAILAL